MSDTAARIVSTNCTIMTTRAPSNATATTTASTPASTSQRTAADGPASSASVPAIPSAANHTSAPASSTLVTKAINAGKMLPRCPNTAREATIVLWPERLAIMTPKPIGMNASATPINAARIAWRRLPSVGKSAAPRAATTRLALTGNHSQNMRAARPTRRCSGVGARPPSSRMLVRTTGATTVSSGDDSSTVAGEAGTGSGSEAGTGSGSRAGGGAKIDERESGSPAAGSAASAADAALAAANRPKPERSRRGSTGSGSMRSGGAATTIGSIADSASSTVSIAPV